ncbi:MAG: DUF2206 domain-containing protein [bacterium]|nr:DUF2206 domain-containing protein [bacterium]
MAIFNFNPLYIGSFLSFLFILITPGFLILPLLTKKVFPVPLGLTVSAALSIFALMVVGLVLNTLLPMAGMTEPLSTVPLLIAFDVLVYLLLILNFEYKENSPFELHVFNRLSRVIAGIAFLLPIFSCIGAISLNNNGSDIFIMVGLTLMIPLILLTIIFIERVNLSIPPLVLFAMALAFLLMNSMRGTFITGHDILLEYHVFSLTNEAHLWSMSFYKDAYMACLSITILPTYLQNLLHVNPEYILKFFMQFIGALPVVMLYYLAKEYVSVVVAFLIGLLYVTFPTSMIDMAFLNRQGVAFLFYGAMIFTLLTTEYFSGRQRMFALFVFGTGMILSHYSTSYIAVPVLIAAYVINRILRIFVLAKWPHWLAILTSKLGNRDIYQRPILIPLSFVIGLSCIMLVWSTLVTKTSSNLYNTLQQIVVAIEHPFESDGYSGPARYSFLQSKQKTPDELLGEFMEKGVKNMKNHDQSDFYPLRLTERYKTVAVPEVLEPVTPLGEKIGAALHIDLTSFLDGVKQTYAKITQLFLLIGLAVIFFSLSSKGNILSRGIPVEYLALSIAGILVMVGQTVLPASAIEYGLLRLFQQNLILLALPIIAGFFYLTAFVIHDHKRQLMFCTVFLVGFFVFLSGLIPQLTGGGRPLLALNNYGLYYDSYYMHPEEVFAMDWTTQYLDPHLPLQAAHFSDIKMVAYGKIQPHIELLPETTRRRAYVYLNFFNVRESIIIETIGGDVLYYYFPLKFLEQNKNLIYSNGGSAIYR